MLHDTCLSAEEEEAVTMAAERFDQALPLCNVTHFPSPCAGAQRGPSSLLLGGKDNGTGCRRCPRRRESGRGTTGSEQERKHLLTWEGHRAGDGRAGQPSAFWEQLSPWGHALAHSS